MPNGAQDRATFWLKEKGDNGAKEASAVIRMRENQSAANRERVLCWRSQIQRRKRGTRCFLACLLQVRAGRRKCVSSAALCTQRYRTHRQGETGWRERGSVVWRERGNGRSLIQSGREKGRVIYVLLQPDSVAGQHEKCQSRYYVASLQNQRAGEKVISSHGNEDKCMVMLNRKL